MDPVVGNPISANPGLNVNPGLLIVSYSLRLLIKNTITEWHDANPGLA